MTSPSAVAGWACIGLALYVPSVLGVTAAAAILHAMHPRLAVPRSILGLAGAGLAVLMWYVIPLAIHAHYGRAGY